MAAPPKHIRALQDERALELEWSDGRKFLLPYRFLREHCPCAGCVDEITGKRILDVGSIPDDVHPTDLKFTGNYALKIYWSDNHDTGLFTWEYLSQLARHDDASSNS